VTPSSLVDIYIYINALEETTVSVWHPEREGTSTPQNYQSVLGHIAESRNFFG